MNLLVALLMGLDFIVKVSKGIKTRKWQDQIWTLKKHLLLRGEWIESVWDQKQESDESLS